MAETQPTAAAGNAFCLPDLGEGLTEAEVVAWHVQVGEHVVADQPVVAVETDKAIVEIPAPHPGRIAKLVVDVGERIRVGDVLFTYTGEASEQSASTSVVGELEQSARPPASASPTLKASPRARQRAQELGVALDHVTPSGPGGVIQASDVEAAAGRPQLRGVRRAMAERMTQADARVVRATITGEADVSRWPDGTRPILRLIRAISRACEAQPLLNARFDDTAFKLSLQSEVNLGLAMESADGLFVPVLRDVTQAEPDAIAADLDKLKTAVANRTIASTDLRGQTITLSNFGAVGGLYADMVVVPPQVAIVGAGRAYSRLAMIDGQPGERRLLPLSITFDHRVVTGIEASEFLLALTRDLELAH